MNNQRTIAYVTGTRADFGLMSAVLQAIAMAPSLRLRLYATGMHLMPEFGQTLDEVKKIFPSVKILPATYDQDSTVGMAKFTAACLQQVVTAFAKDKPDLVLTLGDRAEMLAVATACTYLGIPSAQIHGGEKTFTVDEMARHAITKLSQLHFAATRQSARRIIKMGEEPWRVHVTGAPALDVIMHQPLPSRGEVADFLQLLPEQSFILVTQHPVSEQLDQAADQMRTTLRAVKKFNLPVVVIYPNADAGGRRMIAEIEKEQHNPQFRIFPSLPYTMFLGLEKYAAVWVGNSSAGLVESAAFKTPVVNVGIRQANRQRARNVIDAPNQVLAIEQAMQTALTDQIFLQSLQRLKNPWGDGQTSQRIVKILTELPLDQKLLMKQITY